MHFLKDLDFGYESTCWVTFLCFKNKEMLELTFRYLSREPGSYFTFWSLQQSWKYCSEGPSRRNLPWAQLAGSLQVSTFRPHLSFPAEATMLALPRWSPPQWWSKVRVPGPGHFCPLQNFSNRYPFLWRFQLGCSRLCCVCSVVWDSCFLPTITVWRLSLPRPHPFPLNF